MVTPQVLSRKANGVLPITPSQASAPGNVPKAAKTKAAPEGEKIVVRRLPPGMAEEEFVSILGDDWKIGNGRVDWFSFKPGNISQNPSKPSKPGRAYLHVTKRDTLMMLSDDVRTRTWEDAKESWTSPVLMGPPTVEFAIYKKVPSGKRRTDGRQGTIDQDPEFMDFLEALANPTAPTKGAETEQGEDGISGGKTEGKTTSTPLIEYLREKKANKAKEAANAKGKHSRQESQGGGKGKNSTTAGDESKKTKSEKSPEKSKETVKILTKKAAAEAAVAEAVKAVAAQVAASKEDVPKSRRAGIAAAARILQRDLGLSPGNAHRRARAEASKAENEAKVVTASAGKEAEAAPTTPTATAAPPSTSTPSAKPAAQPSTSGRSRGKKRGEASSEATKGKASADKTTEQSSVASPAKTPVLLTKKKNESSSAGGSQSAARPSTPTPPAGPKAMIGKGGGTQTLQQKKESGGSGSAASATLNSGTTHAFIKHANPSQGVTEALLKETMGSFGSVTFVEIDRRKGFAYVDFADHDGLVKAMAASPVSVAQAAVQVLERKETKKGGGSGSTAKAASTPPATNVNAPPASASSASTAATPAPSASNEKSVNATGASGEHKRGRRGRGGRGKGAEGGSGGGSSNITKENGSAISTKATESKPTAPGAVTSSAPATANGNATTKLRPPATSNGG